MSNHEDVEVFRGHTDECVKHLAVRLSEHLPKGSRGLKEARAPIGKFCGVKDDTINRWLTDIKQMPKGEQLIKLICFLDLQGYRVIELERMKKSRRGFFELIGYGLVSVDDASQMLGFRNQQNLYRVLHGKEGTSEDKDARMWEAWKRRKDALENAKAIAHDESRMPWVTTPSTRPSLEPTVAVEGLKLAPRSAGVVLIMDGLLRLLESGSLREMPLEQLKLLQRQSGTTVLRLSSQLSELSAKLMQLGERQSGGT